MTNTAIPSRPPRTNNTIEEMPVAPIATLRTTVDNMKPVLRARVGESPLSIHKRLAKSGYQQESAQ
ncbi:MAG: hypothetical protein CM15mP2_2300 [Methanobacteriota archaeon]|nr:MAG: hypothetical protein CM15mP2_2300 [Euryarchaeota archaeon]